MIETLPVGYRSSRGWRTVVLDSQQVFVL